MRVGLWLSAARLSWISSRQPTNVAVAIESVGGVETIRAGVVLGADGSRSQVRQTLGIAFVGEANNEAWKLYDIELDVPLARDEAHVFLLDGGGMFVVRHTGDIWRVLGTGADLLGALPAGTRCGRIHWESDFGISNRVAQQFSCGCIYLAGDAAHTHAGIGARGMNLGIEDAFVFAALYDRGQLDRYDQLRRPVVEKVVGQIKRAMTLPRGKSLPSRFVRRFPGVVRVVMGVAHRFAEPWVLGLDHELGIEP